MNRQSFVVAWRLFKLERNYGKVRAGSRVSNDLCNGISNGHAFAEPDHELIQSRLPIPDRQRPFLRRIAQRQVQQFHDRGVVRERAAISEHPA